MREALRGLERHAGEHVALAYDAWAPVGADGKVRAERRKDETESPRDEWLKKLESIQIHKDYRAAFERWKNSFGVPGDRLAEFTLESRLLIGHGNSSATDVGLTVHHTWGVPVIPGSALKGLLAHYVDATYGPSDPSKKPWEQEEEEGLRVDYQGVIWGKRGPERGPGAVYRALFGAPDAREDELMRAHSIDAGAITGLVTFHDALYVPGTAPADRPFVADVLTVHQKAYYDSSGGTWPNDYDSPNPVAFLTVRPKCGFLLALSGPSEWTELAAHLLSEALSKWGIGGKTSAGYGFGNVSEWEVPGPRLSKLERDLAALEAHGRDALRGDIEKWLLDEGAQGPLRERLSSSPREARKNDLQLVRAIVEKFDLPKEWSGRLKNKKADERKKVRARALLEAWERLVSKGVKS